LHPQVRWYPPWLDVGPTLLPPLPGEHDQVERPVQALDGRSFVLVPTVFDPDEPLVLRDPGDALALWSRSGPDHRALAMLLGVSPPTISHHVGVLRDAGLIASGRAGLTVLHYVTPRGAALLEA
jgi:hypothetical protein